MVDTSEDLEGTFVTPSFIPWVNDGPVFDSIFDTPSDDFNGMATKLGSRSMLVDTRFIGQEVFIDGEGSLIEIRMKRLFTSTGPLVKISVIILASPETE